jgi:two-component system CheB/CheR fusion protein
MGRIRALGNSYGLVSRQQWGPVSLNDLLALELKPHAANGHPDRVVLSGPPVLFRPAEALALGQMFHELATNAAKYGALSQEQGRVAVAWKVGNPELTIDWRETGGPEVRKPKRQGFGTEMIERQLKQLLGGSVKFNYAAEGLRVGMKIPMQAFTQTTAEKPG